MRTDVQTGRRPSPPRAYEFSSNDPKDTGTRRRAPSNPSLVRTPEQVRRRDAAAAAAERVASAQQRPVERQA